MTQPSEPAKAEAVDGGHWREDGTFQAPEGWPEGAGWVVRNADGSIAQWGPASDLQLLVSTSAGNGPLPPAADLDVAFVGKLQPQDEDQDG